MAAFGTPQYDDATSVAAGSAADPNAPPQETLDINDPAFTSEALDVNVDADAYAQPVPPPDRRWRAKLKLLKQQVNGQDVDFVPAKWGEDNPQMVLVASVQAVISDPSGKYDGLSAYDGTVSTFMLRSGGHKVQTFLRGQKKPDGTLYVPPGTKLNPRQWMDLLVKFLAGEPEVGIESQWEVTCKGCLDDAKKSGSRKPKALRGMHHFPPSHKVKGEYDPEVRCAVSPAHGFNRARVQIASVFPLSELK